MTIDQAGTAHLDVRLPCPHAKQELFIRSNKKRRIIKAGRRGGKTVGVAIYAVEQFCEGHRILYGVPVSDQLQRFWQEVTASFSNGLANGLLVKNETEHVIEWNPVVIKRLKPGLQKKYLNNRIKAKTCWNADTLRGDYADRLILDEYQLMNEDAWKIVGAPMLIDNFGDAVFCYTPASLHSRSVSKATDKQHAKKLYASAEKNPDWLAVHFTSYDNPYLSVEGLDQVAKDMSVGARKQEILAEETDDVPGALWKQDWIDDTRVDESQVPDLERIVVGVDPSGSSTTEAGIVCCGRGAAPRNWMPSPQILRLTPNVMSLPHIYILADSSLAAPTPMVWAQAAVNLYYERKADRLFGERNYGGDMVQSTIRQAQNGQGVAYSDANATRGKMIRAEPVAAACQRGLVHHVGIFPELETEMCSFVPGDPSPNRVDGCVWGALRLLEGIDVLGLLDYFKTGQAEAEYDSMDKSPKLTAPVVPVSVGCPECGAPNMQEIPGGRRCQQCGIQTTSKTNGNAHGVTRDSYLRGDWGPPR